MPPQIPVYLEPQDVLLFGNRLFADALKDQDETGLDQSSVRENKSILTRDRNGPTETQRRLCEDGSEDCSSVATRQRTPGANRSRKRPGRILP